LRNNRIAIDLGNKYIRLLVGKKTNITNFGIINTPEGSFIDDKIEAVEPLSDTISEFLTNEKIKVKKVNFVLKGQDIIIRHIETPIIDDEGIRKVLQWENEQYLPGGTDNYYVDYEIVEKISNKEKKAYKVIAVSVPKEKVDKYVELSEKLKLELNAIDISHNCIARVFKDVFKKNKDIENMGVIAIGYKSSTITILENSKLVMEREVSFGIYNIIMELAKVEELEIANTELEKRFFNEFSFTDLDIFKQFQSEIYSRVRFLFDNVFTSFNKVIQFYTTGKTKKILDRIYIIGEGADIRGIDRYLSTYFNTMVKTLNSFKNSDIRMSVPVRGNLKLYINAYGLLLRKE
jgi:type IV pilus assembly protein PilM